jgi:signal transduction histidine kinase
LALFFASACHSPQNNDNRQAENFVMPDTVFASTTDSLEWMVTNVKLPVPEQIRIYQKLCNELVYNDIEKTNYYGNLALELLQKEKNDTLACLIYSYLGMVYTFKNNYDTAKVYFDEGLRLAIKLEDERDESWFYNAFNVLYSKQGNYAASIEYLEKAIRLAEKKEEYDILATALANIGNTYYEAENYEEAEKYLLRAIEIYHTKVENQVTYVFSFMYRLLSIINFAQKKYREAQETAQKALDYAQLSSSKSHEINALLSLAHSYTEYNVDYHKAIELANRGLEIVSELDSQATYETIRADCYQSLGGYHYLIKDYAKSEMYLLKALDLTSLVDTPRRKNITRDLLNLLALSKETDRLMASLITYDSLSVEINEQKLQFALSDLNVKYETEKKEFEIERQQQIISRRTMERGLLAGGVAVAMVILFLLWYMLRLRNRRNVALSERNTALSQRTDTLSEMNATKDKFFNIISHDMKSPALTQRDAIQMLVDNGRHWDADTLSEYYHGLLKSANGQVELIYNLLNWAQVQTGRMTCTPAPIILSTLYSELSLIRKMAENKGITLTVSIPEDAIVTGDVNMLSAVVRNLLTNAVKFTPTGGTVALDISPVSGEHAGSPLQPYSQSSILNSQFTVSVSDTGLGMSREQINNLFRLDSAQSVRGTAGEKGTGLGLIVCKEFLDKHNTVLHIESEKGKGSRFWFTV